MKISIILFLILGLGFIIYSNALGGDFVWDDIGFIIYNDYIKDISLFPTFFKSADALAKGSLAAENYRPFLVFSYAIDYALWRLDPLGYHLINILLHTINAMLVFWLLMLITKQKFLAAVTAIFFLAHPIQTESVAWISGRADVLFLFFYLASFIFYIKYRKEGGKLFYIGALFLFCGSLLSKEMAASLPAILILFDLLYQDKDKIVDKVIRYFPFFLILEVFIIIRLNVLGRLAQCDWWAGTFYETMLSMSRGTIYYIRLLFFPIGQCADYVSFPTTHSIKDPAAYLSIISILLIFTCAITLRKKHKSATFAIFWFFITLAPAANFIPIRILIAERFLYAPSIGFCVILALILNRIYKNGKCGYIEKTVSFFCAGAILITYSYLTMDRNKVWLEATSFSEDIVKKYPDNKRAHHNLSLAYYASGNKYMSLHHVKKALEIAPDYTSARKMLAVHYINSGNLEEAIEECNKVLKYDPDSKDTHNYLAFIYVVQGKHDLAAKEYRKALAKDPSYIEAKIGLINISLLKDERKKAISEINRLLEEPAPIHGRTIMAAEYLRLGELYAREGDLGAAKDAWQKVYDNFKEQYWFNKIAGYLIDEIQLEVILADIKDWEPDFKVFFYYFAGIKKETLGDEEAAVDYYKKAALVNDARLNQLQIFAVKRMNDIKNKEK